MSDERFPVSELKKRHDALKVEKRTLENARERVNYTLRKTRKNMGGMADRILQLENSNRHTIILLQRYLALYSTGFAGRFLSEECKQFKEELEVDEKLDEPLLQGDNILSWLVKKAITQLGGDPYVGSKMS